MSKSNNRKRKHEQYTAEHSNITTRKHTVTADATTSASQPKRASSSAHKKATSTSTSNTRASPVKPVIPPGSLFAPLSDLLAHAFPFPPVLSNMVLEYLSDQWDGWKPIPPNTRKAPHPHSDIYFGWLDWFVDITSPYPTRGIYQRLSGRQNYCHRNINGKRGTPLFKECINAAFYHQLIQPHIPADKALLDASPPPSPALGVPVSSLSSLPPVGKYAADPAWFALIDPSITWTHYRVLQLKESEDLGVMVPQEQEDEGDDDELPSEQEEEDEEEEEENEEDTYEYENGMDQGWYPAEVQLMSVTEWIVLSVMAPAQYCYFKVGL